MRAVPLLAMLCACEKPPALESNPEVLWFRSSSVVSPSSARQIVQETAEQPEPWAEPLYVFSPRASGGHHLVGHQRLYLREYEAAVGQFRAVAPDDDREMGCASLRRTLDLLTEWSRRFEARWDLRLGGRHGRVPGNVTRIEEDVCRGITTVDTVAVTVRYSDRPR
jgi:(2Fe-2S) ferredoxin